MVRLSNVAAVAFLLVVAGSAAALGGYAVDRPFVAVAGLAVAVVAFVFEVGIAAAIR